MSDIVERLRDWQDYEPLKRFGGDALKDMAEAADEIERLQAVVKRLHADRRALRAALTTEQTAGKSDG